MFNVRTKEQCIYELRQALKNFKRDQTNLNTLYLEDAIHNYKFLIRES